MLTKEKKILTDTMPRLGFLGVGWIGRNRLQAIHESKNATIASICDSDSETAGKAAEGMTGCSIQQTYEEMLRSDIDGIVIATPSAEHAAQVRLALEHKKAVFVQKPLALNATVTKELVDLAASNDCLLKVDFSYRYTRAMEAVKQVLDSGEIGEVFSAELIFHNAYGPDKDWYYDVRKAGGGCLTDLGIHLIDLLYWAFPSASIESQRAHFYKGGKRLHANERDTEDYAAAGIQLDNNVHANIACSWNLNAGQEAIIEARFYGSKGGVQFRNLNGSFYDFEAAIMNGTSRHVLENPPDNWSGRAGVAWAEQLSRGNEFDHTNEEYIKVAETLDMLYGNF